MADKITKEKRSDNMKAIHSVSKLENAVTKALWAEGLRVRKNVRDLFGKPDIALKKYRVVIFIDSCFWHGCLVHGTMPKSNIDFWINKLNRNQERDAEVTDYYIRSGWNILRIWEHELRDDFTGAVNKIYDFINFSKNQVFGK